MMWIAIFGFFILFTIFAFIFLWRQMGKYYIFRKNRLLRVIPFIAMIIYVVLDSVPAIIAITHLVVFWIIIEAAFKLVDHFRKNKMKKDGIYVQGILAITVTTVYLLVAWFLAVNVVQVYYEIDSEKVEGDDFRIVMFADSHIGSTFDGKKLAEYIHEMGELNPDILVIVGDYVDDDSKKVDMLAATKALGEIETTYGVYYVFGNHDKGYYNARDFDENDLRNALTEAGVTILEDEVVRINEEITLIGRQDRSEPERADIAELMKDVDEESFALVLNHQPNDQKAEHDAGVDMVLSGHTHGGQLLPITYVGEWTGVNDQTKGMRVIDQISYIVTSGISDWAIPFKTGCRAEYQVIDIK